MMEGDIAAWRLAQIELLDAVRELLMQLEDGALKDETRTMRLKVDRVIEAHHRHLNSDGGLH